MNTKLPTNDEITALLKPALEALSPANQPIRVMDIGMELIGNRDAQYKFSIWISTAQTHVRAKSLEELATEIAAFDSEAAIKAEIAKLEKRLADMKGAVGV